MAATYALPTEEDLPKVVSFKGYYRHINVLEADNVMEAFKEASTKKNPICVIFLVVYGLCDYEKFGPTVDDILRAFPEMLTADELYRFLELVYSKGMYIPTKRKLRSLFECEGLRLEKLSFLYPHVHKWKTPNSVYTEEYMKSYQCLREHGVPIPENYLELLKKVPVCCNDTSSKLIRKDLTIQQ